MNGRVGRIEVASVVGKWGLNEVNKNGEYLLDICVELREGMECM